MNQPDPMPWSRVADRVEAICLALPETTMRSEDWGRLFNIRRNTFCFLTARQTPEGTYLPTVVLRTDPEEREVLLAIGPPYFDSRGGLRQCRGCVRVHVRLLLPHSVGLCGLLWNRSSKPHRTCSGATSRLAKRSRFSPP